MDCPGCGRIEDRLYHLPAPHGAEPRVVCDACFMRTIGREPGEHDPAVELSTWKPSAEPAASTDPRDALDSRFERVEDGGVVLYRPVGQAELDLIREADWRAFPPRLHWQPIFYPVLNAEYATMIAERWNTKDPSSGNVGYVLRFTVRPEAVAAYQVKVVGSDICQELWVPAAELAALNKAIVGKIQVIAEYHGSNLPI